MAKVFVERDVKIKCCSVPCKELLMNWECSSCGSQYKITYVGEVTNDNN